MLIILEGVDKSGKSSLAKYLSNRLEIPIVKFSAPIEDAYIEYMDFLLNQRMPVIADRFHLGEDVYGPIKRGKSMLNDWKRRNIEEILMMRNPLTIYCETNVGAVSKSFIDDKETFTLQSEILPIIEGFRQVIDKSILEWRVFDYQRDPTYSKISILADEWFNDVQAHSFHLEALRVNRTKGDFYAKVLIIGDQCNGGLEAERYKPCVIPFGNGPSAEKLYKALDLAGFKQWDYALSNVYKWHLDGNVGEIEAELRLPCLEKIICLGNNTHEAVVQSMKEFNVTDIEVRKVFHPSYIARKGLSVEEYANQLKDAYAQ